jgi:hypothetical protein
MIIIGSSVSGIILIMVTDLLFLAFLIFPVILVLMYLASVARNIFLCGLYVYASEGVVPGTFDAEIFDNAWKIKKVKKAKSGRSRRPEAP